MGDAFYERLAKLDRVIATGPDRCNFRVDVLPMIKEPSSEKYFYEKIDGSWIHLISNEGVFSSPPAPERNDSDGRTSFSVWQPSRYLARVAASYSEDVVAVILSMPETENPIVNDDIVDVALHVDATLGVRLLPLLIRSLGHPYNRYYVHKIGPLVSHFVTGGQSVHALAVASTLLRIPAKRGHLDVWEYEEFLKHHLRNLVEGTRLSALDLVCDVLEETIEALRAPITDAPDDGSYLWRPAIEEHSQNLSSGFEGALVTAVRDTAEQIVKHAPGELANVIHQLDSKRWQVFSRISLYLLSRNSSLAPELVVCKLTNRVFFSDAAYRHEYAGLARSAQKYLDPESVQVILGWVGQGPEFGLEGSVPSGTTEVEAAAIKQRYKNSWVRDMLSMFSEILSGDWRRLYENLVAELGPAARVDFPIYHSEVWSGPSSPTPLDGLQTMPVDQLARYLREWTPTEDFMAPSIEGLGRELEGIVKAEPQRFAEEADSFVGLDPTYVRAFISGLTAAIQADHIFDWIPVLRLCGWVFRQPDVIPRSPRRLLDRDPDWSWTRKAIARLLLEGFDSKPGTIPYKLRRDAWMTLLPLTSDPDPTPEHEAEFGGKNMDPATLSINTVRGDALHAVVRYGLWVRRNNASKDNSAGFDAMPEVREVLDEHLSVSKDPSLAVRSVYGRWFPWLVTLDPSWADDATTRIFPQSPELFDFWTAAWEAYVAFNVPYKRVFNIVKSEYERALTNLGRPINGRRLMADPDERLGEHLVTLFWQGATSLKPRELLPRFFQEASPALRTRILEFVGRSLGNNREALPPAIVERLQTLWEWRLSRTVAGDWAGDDLGAFGWWFTARKFDDRWAIGQLKQALQQGGKMDGGHALAEHLAESMTVDPQSTLECLALLVEADQDHYWPRVWQEHVEVILRQALCSSHSELKEQAVGLINRLGELGILNFRHLLSMESL